MDHGCDKRLDLNRRRFIHCLSAMGLGSTLLPGALMATAKEAELISISMLEAAARVAGLTLTTDELSSIVDRLNGEDSLFDSYATILDLELPNSVPPAFVFNPVPPGMKLPHESRPLRLSDVPASRPGTDEELAFLPVHRLAKLIETRAVSSTDLTKLYLARLKEYDPRLHCVVTLTEELALRQAKQADDEIMGGHYRGPLHGIPWGAKDLLAVKGYPTTWGASPYKKQTIDLNATVYERLTDAGAVLVAKLTMGALAQGDRWFGGRTRNPWKLDQGSSGSSAGSGSATAAGLVGFAIGTETRGSIISPSSRCGITGLRPTFGRVSRYGAMALSWTMDKIGPMCRSAEDCAIVLRAINGPDGNDNTLLDVPFNWDSDADVSQLRVGCLKSLIEGELPSTGDENADRLAREEQVQNEKALQVIRKLGIDLKPIELPDLPSRQIGFVLTTEAAAAFDDLTRSDRDRQMMGEPESSRWPEAFRLHRFVPAVEYIQANRVRTLMVKALDELFADIDLFIGSDLALTNLTGHPEIVMPHGFRSDGTPTNLRFTGKLFGEADIALLAHAFQEQTHHHLKRPNLRV